MHTLLFYAFCAGIFFGVILGSGSLIALRGWSNKEEQKEREKQDIKDTK